MLGIGLEVPDMLASRAGAIARAVLMLAKMIESSVKLTCSEVLRVWVLDRVAQERIVQRQYARALGNEVSLVEIVRLNFMRDTGRNIGFPAHGLLDARTKSW